MSQLYTKSLYYYAWKISNISVSQDEEFSLDSPSFTTGGATWCLRSNFYAKTGEEFSTNYLYLVRLESHFLQHSLFSLIVLKDSSNKIVDYYSTQEVFEEDLNSILLAEDLTYNIKDNLLNGPITVYFLMLDLKGVQRKKTASPERLNFEPVEGVEKLANDMKNLLFSETDSDVTISVEGREFPAHKAIIGARSPVFAAMLRSEMKEKATGVVNIEDMDPKVLQDFLSFLYTAHKNVLSVKNVFGLYKAADLYDVQELKSSCVQFMKQSLSVETFCNVVSISLLYDEKELLQEVITYFSEHVIEILETVEWQRFLNQNAVQGNELLIKALREANCL